MKVRELFEDDGYDERIRNDRRLENRLKVLDQNIQMFSNKIYDKDASIQKRIQEFKDGKELLKKFYAGEIERSAVPYRIWELTSSMPSWGTYGT